MKTSEEVRYSV